MNQKYKYEINGKTYIQKPLVLGQLNRLLGILKYFRIQEGAGITEIAMTLGDKLPEALAIVLIEGDKTARQMAEAETRAALIADIEECVDLEQAVEIIQDFFDCNPIASISSKVQVMLEGLKEKTTPVAKM